MTIAIIYPKWAQIRRFSWLLPSGRQQHIPLGTYGKS